MTCDTGGVDNDSEKNLDRADHIRNRLGEVRLDCEVRLGYSLPEVCVFRIWKLYLSG